MNLEIHEPQMDINTKDIAKNYSNLLEVNVAVEKKEFHNSIENLLTKLDALINLADSIRMDDNIALNSTLENIHTKCQQFDKHFDYIDRLEILVRNMKKNVDDAELSVNRAEKELGRNAITSAIEHIPFLSNIKKQKASSISYSFIPYNITDTKKYFTNQDTISVALSQSLPDVIAHMTDMNTIISTVNLQNNQTNICENNVKDTNKEIIASDKFVDFHNAT